MASLRKHRVRRIVSGGQTGVDRGALDAAILLGIAHGGWCPAGRLAEDGPIADVYHLTETPSPDYAVRTEQNVVDSDATLILCRGELTGGTQLTYQFARQHDKPVLSLDLGSEPDLADVAAWLAEHNVTVLNIAGPRESTCPGIGAAAEEFVQQLFSPDLTAVIKFHP